MTRSEDTIWCDGCGTEILWSPYIVQQQDFCCQDCASGIPCKCAEIMDWDDEYQNATGAITGSYFGN
jgi:hypothetical protein